MDLTPPSLTRSPTFSPNTNRSTGSPPAYYPSPVLLNQQHYDTAQALAVRTSCSMAVHQINTDQPHPPPSAPGGRDSSGWSSSSLVATATSSPSIPNVLSVEYDPFASYDAPAHGSYEHDAYPSHLSEHGHGTAQTTHPNPGSMARQDPYLSSRALPYHHGNGASKPKAGGHSEYGPVESSDLAASRSLYGADPSGYHGSSHHNYISEQHLPGGGWQRSQAHKDVSSYASTEPQSGGASNHDPRQEQQGKGGRPRKNQRRLTTREEANFQCEIKGCGKLFSRSYNYKAHMETHDEKREYPFPCQVEGCDKKFVRKTDLQRHHQSVHAKERNHSCDYCGRLFARKDTLRRHMDDGCSRRFDVGTLDLRSDSYNGTESSRRAPGGAESNQIVTSSGTSLPPLVMPTTSENHESILTPTLLSSASARTSNTKAGQGHDWPRQ